MDNKKLPIYNAVVSKEGETGVQFIALVEQPAIEVNWQAFSASEKPFKFEKIEQQKLAGPLMIPDIPIYRFDKEVGEYYIQFSKETIALIAEKFNRNSINKNINLEHNDNEIVPNTFLTENWIVDDENDKSKKYGFNLPSGSWFGIVKVDDQNFWNQYIKTGKVLGFSIEGMLGMEKISKMKKEKFAEVLLKTGNLFVEAEVAVGVPVFQSQVRNVLIDGKLSKIMEPAWDANYETQDGRILVVLNGNIVEIKQNTAMNKMNFTDAKTADGRVFTSDYKIGSNITMKDENGKEVPVLDGEYKMEDGSVVYVKEGVISDIKEKSAQVAPAAMADAPATEPTADKPADKPAEEPTDVKAMIDDLTGKVTMLMDRIAVLEKVIEDAKVKDTEEVMMEKIEKKLMSKLPGAKSATKFTAIQPEKKTETVDMVARINQIKNSLKK